ncbi:MAG: hypothetical protein AAF960_18735 [Bacteroidota bacterium]
MNRQDRIKLLTKYTTEDAILAELAAYTKNNFVPDDGLVFPQLPLPNEPHILAWQTYQKASHAVPNIITILKRKLLPLNFPITKNISKHRDYRKVTLQGQNPQNFSLATGLPLLAPEKINVTFVEGAAGKIPALVVENTADFKMLLRALAHKNEPAVIPDAMGAVILKGVNNWGRFRENMDTTLAVIHPQKEFLRIAKQKSLYQDTIILASKKKYSNVQPKGISADTWREQSLKIRLQHEYAHYFTSRYFGVMRNLMHDEIIADYLGIHAVRSHFDTMLFLQFLGLENYPIYRKGGRLENYLGRPKLSKPAFLILQKIMLNAAHNIAKFDAQIGVVQHSTDLFTRVRTLATLSLVQIADEQGANWLTTCYGKAYKER